MKRSAIVRSLTISALALGTALVVLAPAAAEHPNHARGFRPGHVYDFEQIENVNLFNGNLSLTIPIGQEYPLGPNLSYGLTLTYSGNVWEWEEQCPDYPDKTTCFLQSFPRQTNAGLGWELSLGKVTTKQDPFNNDSEPVYVTPDQAEHRLNQYRLHPNGESFTGNPELYFTQDSTYLRRSSSANTVEFPDGTVQQFGGGNLTQIRDRFSPLNKLDITYDAADPDGICTATHQWKLKDSYGRIHCVTFGFEAGQLVVESVKLQKFGGGQAEYTFDYATNSFPRTCNNPVTAGDGSNVTFPRLTAINLPDGTRFKMAGNPPSTNPYYHAETSNTIPGCQSQVEGLNGALERIDLPTGGRFEYTWRPYGFPAGSANFKATQGSYTSSPFSTSIGLSERRHVSGTGTPMGTWTYASALTPFDDNYPSNRELVNTVTDPLGHFTEHYFTVYPGSSNLPPTDPPGGWTKDEYGLPFTRRIQDGTSGRYLSQEVFDKNGTLLRSTYVRYERSGSTSANPRVASTRTVFQDDLVGGVPRSKTVDLSDFDGLGHYRHRVSNGDFGRSTSRTEQTEYNPGRSISDIPNPTEPWVLNTFTKQTTTEGGQQATREYCFDGNTGFLKRVRSWKSTSTAGSRGASDVIVERTVGSRGFASDETSYGGDLSTVPTGALCGLDLSSSAVTLKQHHVYSCGTLATTQVYSGGAPLSFLSADRTIDCSTGRVSKSRDTAGLETVSTYDAAGRLTKQDLPAGEGADVFYSYTNANSSSPAKVTLQAKDGATVLTEQQIELDPFGRVDLERRRMPDGTWSERSTKTDALGRVYRRSEWEAAGDPDPSYTDLSQFDPFGRPGKVTLPDGHVILMTYSGVGRRTTKVPVGTGVAADGTVTESQASTTEFFDCFGRLYDVREPGYPNTAARTVYDYDVLGNLDRVEMNPGQTTSQVRTFNYDGRGFLTSETHPELGTSILYSLYDALGNVGRVRRGPWDLRYSYDAARRLVKIHDQGTGRDWKEWTYATANSQDPVDGSFDWSRGKLRSMTRHNWVLAPGSTTTWLDPKVTETYTYSGVGGRIARVATDVNVGGFPHFDYSLTYDQLGDVTSRSYPQCTHQFCSEANVPRTISGTYTRGFLTQVIEPGSTLLSTLTYHPNGLIKAIQHVNGVSLLQDRDPSDMLRPRRIRTTGSDGDMDTGFFQYDGAGNIVGVGSERYIYDLQSRIEQGDLSVTSLLCNDLALHGTIESGSALHEACGNLTADSGYTVTGTGSVNLRAGNKIVLDGPVSVQPGGYLKAEVDPTLSSGQQGIVSKSQSYTYDFFGNLLSATTNVEGQASVPRTFGTDSATNRLTVASYDTSGNITSWAGSTFDYDPFNMLRHSSGHVYVYGPGDERIWDIDWTGGTDVSTWVETWTLRGLDGSPLRQFEAVGGNATGNWSLSRDYVWGGGSLLAAYTPSGVLHFFSDHLGSPRLVTDASGTVLARHRYYPYGEEATDPNQDLEVIKFTGHERDFHGTGTTDDLDYMHARYFSVNLGRFLSVDPVLRDTSNPQSWNRYTYVRGNPLKYVDLTGEIVSLSSLSDTEIQKLLEALSEATGNEYGVDDDGNLMLVELGAARSETGTQIVEDLVNNDRTFMVQACNGCGIRFAGSDNSGGRIYLDFSDFGQLDFGKVTPGSFGLGMHFLHEGLHQLNPSKNDPSGPGERGFFVDRVNKVRRERGLDVRDQYVGSNNYGKVTVFFEARGWKRKLGIRNKVQFPDREVSQGPAPPH